VIISQSDRGNKRRENSVVKIIKTKIKDHQKISRLHITQYGKQNSNDSAFSRFAFVGPRTVNLMR